MNANRFNVLLVEDNPADVRLTEVAISECTNNIDLSIVNDGVEALKFLRREAPYSSAPHPDLVFLDLNMPKKDGREVLAEIKNDEDLKHIPVVVITTSDAESDISQCYKLHANCYIAKPVDLDDFMRVVKSVQNYWLTIARLPKAA